ncbi:hypothetical protein GCK72_000691 [Caenorhabditis remanei]|uniref:Uncharacterized protein n=1 Tax=Caenorhabditis remanei TaxID=31234 RepID=A0A6A5HLU7_CAERE|nr:hypothetical protein GCK72_000691 [Caenorhabditis remanei]KAF1768878.1 hypothetical protein GCK72_000691 [Caenorhabditis remanei]
MKIDEQPYSRKRKENEKMDERELGGKRRKMIMCTVQFARQVYRLKQDSLLSIRGTYLFEQLAYSRHNESDGRCERGQVRENESLGADRF